MRTRGCQGTKKRNSSFCRHIYCGCFSSPGAPGQYSRASRFMCTALENTRAIVSAASCDSRPAWVTYN